LLSERGLVAALEALALQAPVPVDLEALPDRLLPEQIEAVAYYVVAEALANVHKHIAQLHAPEPVETADGGRTLALGEGSVLLAFAREEAPPAPASSKRSPRRTTET
jgi:hypothetical protein